MGFSLVCYSMPLFWWALILIFVFSVHWGLTPVSGRIDVLFDLEPVTGFLLLDCLIQKNFAAFVSALRHLILPTLALGTIPLAVIARMARSSMLEVIDQDYMRTARAKAWGRGECSGFTDCAMLWCRLLPSLVCSLAVLSRGPF